MIVKLIQMAEEVNTNIDESVNEYFVKETPANSRVRKAIQAAKNYMHKAGVSASDVYTDIIQPARDILDSRLNWLKTEVDY